MMSRAAWGGSPVPVLAGLQGLEPRSAIDTSPFAGLLIVLLITYMVITPGDVVGHQMPRARTAQVIRDTLPTLGIDSHGAYFVDDRRVAGDAMPGALRTRMADLSSDVVLITATYDVEYATIEQALRDLQVAGVRRVVLEAYPPPAARVLP